LTPNLTNLVKQPIFQFMKQLNLYEAKTNFSSLVDEAEAGEVVIIAKNGKPKAKLVALEEGDTAIPKREFGHWGKLYGWKAPEVFPETTPEEIALWEDGPVFPDDTE
jgi:prevent-host-death family protein